MSETRRLCGVPSEREECCRVDSQGYTLGWYAMPLQGMEFETGLGHGIGNGSTLRQNEIETDKKTFGETFGETFGAATGVSDPSYPPSLDCFQNQSETLWLLSRTAERSTGSREGQGLAKFIFALGSLGELGIRAEVFI